MEKRKLAVCLLLSVLVTFSIFAYVSASGSFGFEVYEPYTRAWHINLDTVYVGIPKSFNVTVECKEKTGEFLITYHLEISGPESLYNDYLRVRWQDTDGADFAVGKDGDRKFSGIGTLTWNSDQPVVFEAGHKNNVKLTLIFLTTAAIGNYNAKMWVEFTEKPIKAWVLITPKVLNIKGKDQWVTAYISLPKPYEAKDIDINSVKLWYKEAFVQAKWGFATRDLLIVRFARNEVVEMFKSKTGLVQLSITGLVNGIQFSGKDTIIVIRT